MRTVGDIVKQCMDDGMQPNDCVLIIASEVYDATLTESFKKALEEYRAFIFECIDHLSARRQEYCELATKAFAEHDDLVNAATNNGLQSVDSGTSAMLDMKKMETLRSIIDGYKNEIQIIAKAKDAKDAKLNDLRFQIGLAPRIHRIEIQGISGIQLI